MTPDKVRVVIYDAPAPKSSSCACGCSGHGHDHHGPATTPWPESAWRCRQGPGPDPKRRLPRPGGGGVCQRAHRPPGAESPPNRVAELPSYPAPLVYLNGQGRFAGPSSRNASGKRWEKFWRRHTIMV